MKTQFNKTWLIISIIIIFNVLVFSFMSRHLESYVSDTMIDQNELAIKNINNLK